LVTLKYEYIDSVPLINHINQNTISTMLNHWTHNTLANLDLIRNSVGIKSFINIFKDKPAVITSAGEDLDNQIPILQRYKDRVVIVSPETVLKKLLDNGITPDIVVVNDGTAKIKEHIKAIDTSGMYLVSCTWVHPELLLNWRGKIVFFLTMDNTIGLYDITKEVANRDLGFIIAGGCVAHTCLLIALTLGCIPILIGQNLSWKEKMYAKDVPTLADHRGHEFKTFDIYGNEVITNEVFWTYRYTFDMFIGRLQPRPIIYNATDGGILGVNYDYLSLYQAWLDETNEKRKEGLKIVLDNSVVCRPTENLKLVKFDKICLELCGEIIEKKKKIDEVWQRAYNEIIKNRVGQTRINACGE